MPTAHEPYIGYYNAANIIPARQKLDDLAAHFRRRRALYRMLGIAPGLLTGKSILEIGPGPGDNAIYTQSLKPARYVLVDANPASLASLREKLADGTLDASVVEAVEGNLLTYVPDQPFDVVLCEGLLPGQHDPGQCLARIGQFVAPGGVVVITNMTSYSILSEICRRAVLPYFKARTAGETELLDALVEFFTPDLDSLTHTSRHYVDWVQDTILHPWQRNMSFTIADAIEAVSGDFEFFGSSPQFLTDTRWYKVFTSEKNTTNAEALSQYNAKKLIYLDYRVDEMAQPANVGSLDGLVDKAIDLHCDIWEGDTDKLDAFLDSIAAIADLIRPALDITSRSLDDYIAGMSALARGGKEVSFGSFVSFFGRGQQYSSFVKNG